MEAQPPAWLWCPPGGDPAVRDRMSTSTARFDRLDDVPATERDAMRSLLHRHFHGVSAESFAADLADKTHALRLFRGGELVGFSTLAHDRSGDHPFVCSGDTVMDPSAWSSPDLPRAWIHGVRSLEPAGCDWLLLCGGFRTYRLLSTFWTRFVPHHAGDEPELLARRDALAAARFGDRFDAATGVVRVAHPTPLRAHLAGIPAGRATHPHVACFARLNPGAGDGDELACLCETTDANLTRAGRRMLA